MSPVPRPPTERRLTLAEHAAQPGAAPEGKRPTTYTLMGHLAAAGHVRHGYDAQAVYGGAHDSWVMVHGIEDHARGVLRRLTLTWDAATDTYAITLERVDTTTAPWTVERLAGESRLFTKHVTATCTRIMAAHPASGSVEDFYGRRAS